VEDALDELIKLTPNLPNLITANESSVMWENVIVDMGLISKGSEFKDSKRNGFHEHFHIIRGKITFRLENKNRTLVGGDHIHILPDESYWVFASKDTRYIYVAFPPNGD